MVGKALIKAKRDRDRVSPWSPVVWLLMWGFFQGDWLKAVE